jgi:hypothetical protein
MWKCAILNYGNFDHPWFAEPFRIRDDALQNEELDSSWKNISTASQIKSRLCV